MTPDTAARRKLPIGIQTFREICEGGYYYVDKTPYLNNLIHGGKHYFLFRPRRHANNALEVPGYGDGPAGQCKLIDPDGMFAERACDLAVPMREWSASLASSPVQLARERCSHLAEFSGAGERAIWQWGCMERVSSGMLLVEIGVDQEGLEMLAIADRLAESSAPV